MFICGSLQAHEWTPTYPKWEYSFLEGISVAKMEIFNSREEVDYFEIQVFDEAFNPIRFRVPEGPIVKVDYLERKDIEVYIQSENKKHAVYICSRSKSILNSDGVTFLASRICSKVK